MTLIFTHSHYELSKSIVAETGVDTAFIASGLPWHNKQLAGEITDTLAEAKYLADEWKEIYHHDWSHGSL